MAATLKNSPSPQLETLETRILMTSNPASWGINIDGNVDWNSMGAWVDVTKTFRRWGDIDKPWTEAEFYEELTTDGIPLSDSGAISYLRGYSAGTYTLSYEGTGNVSIGGLGEILDDTRVVENGLTLASVQVGEPSGEALLHLRISDVDPNDPVRNLRLIVPGYEASTDQAFREEFTHRLSPFSAIRFMDWADTNNSEAISWADRRLPSDSIQTTGFGDKSQGGVAWELMIQLANEVGTDAWINVPHQADDNYIRELAKLWRDNLNPGSKLIVEYSNEPWNTMFDQAKYGQADYYEVVGPRVLTVSRIFREEFAGTGHELEVVLSGQSANEYHVNRAIQYMMDQGFQPNDVIDAIAIAPYFHADANTAFANTDEIFSAIEQQVAAMVAHQGVAESHNVKLYAYEAGQHLLSGATAEDIIRDAQHDPRMAEAYRTFNEAWNSIGGDLVMAFSLARHGNSSGYWGLLEDIREPGSTKWDAVMDIMLDRGDANLDGVTDFEDFLILEENFGKSQMWWEQGDFNGNNTVDKDDFTNLVNDLEVTTLTAEQRERIEQFGASISVNVPVADAPIVSVSMSEASIVESSPNSIAIEFTRTNMAAPLDVSYTVFGSASQEDFDAAFTGSIHFKAGESTVTIPLTTRDDVITEPNESLRIELNPSGDYFVGQRSAQLLIIDDDESLLAGDSFDGSGPLDRQETGFGFNNEELLGDVGWYVQNHDTSPDGYSIVQGSLQYGDLLTSGGHLVGGHRYLAAGRKLGVSDEFADFQQLGTDYIGRDGRTLWMSVVVNRTEAIGSGSSPTRVSLNTSSTPWFDNDRIVSVGYFGLASHVDGQAYWSLEVDGHVQTTDVPINVGESALLVVQIDFQFAADTVSLFVNPAELGGEAPDVASARLSADVRFRNLSYYAGNSINSSSIDEIRFGESFSVVTPTAADDSVDATPLLAQTNTTVAAGGSDFQTELESESDSVVTSTSTESTLSQRDRERMLRHQQLVQRMTQTLESMQMVVVGIESIQQQETQTAADLAKLDRLTKRAEKMEDRFDKLQQRIERLLEIVNR